MVLAKAKKAQRWEWAMMARKQGAKPLIIGPVRLGITFAPKSHHAQDVDNCLASIKAGLDGLADILCVNDSEFRITPTMTAPIKGGAGIIEVS